jgi:mitogen-activated protein kinase kinase
MRIYSMQIIAVDVKKQIRKQLMSELQIMHDCHSEYLLNFFGVFEDGSNNVIMCTEYMDVG